MNTTRYSASTNGFYANDVDYGDKLPGDLVEVTPEAYVALFEAQNAGHVIRPDANGNPVAIDPHTLLTLDELKAAKLRELSAAFSSSMSGIKAGYPAEEVDSWLKQEAEARAYPEPTPLLSAMAAARDIDLADLVARVIANADAWVALSGALIGKRQKYEDEINAATTPEAVAAVHWV